MDARLRIGASSWSAPSWEGVFYPPGTPPSGYLEHYAKHADTVEVDATFYRIPTARMVDAWRDRTPPGFLFAAKFPQVITHEKLLLDCASERDEFLRVMDRLGDRLGPLLLQFRYYRKDDFPDPNPFIDRLETFLPSLPPGRRYAVEVRNKSFVTRRLIGILRQHRVALALIDHPWFFGVDALMRMDGILTTDFAYIRWLGDRKGIETKTTRWDRLIVDRRRDLGRWIPAIRGILDRGVTVYGYFNNHYAGYAIGSIEMFREMWEG
ncbi:MAG TPA: DUF72 domain-containing protein [Candidatus Polarisedimenticolia bacterium]|jgi:uncharacterized protein YecE (DUF72 family)|nr:DUF72 domain-containing protein [Candidatus Polarisedimenticolia bacterium]